MKFRPCIDLHNGKVKQIVGGSLRDSAEGLVENYVSENGAAYYAGLYKSDGLEGGHIIMLGPGNEVQALGALKAYPGGMQIGGGVTPENASCYLDAGASHVIVTSYVFRDGEVDLSRLKKLVSAVGREKLVLDLSCRQRKDAYYVVTDRWQKFTSFQITEENLALLAGYCAEFLIHAADVEGRREGIQSDLVSQLGEWMPLPATYAGGVAGLEDLDLVYQLGQGRLDITVGSALDIFGGRLAYRDVLNWQMGK